MVSDNGEMEKSPIHLGGKITNTLSCNPTKNRQGEKQAAPLPSLRESWKWFSTMTSAEDDQESPSALSGASLAESEEENTPIALWHGHKFSGRIRID